MILDEVVSHLMEMDEPPPLDRDLSELLGKLVEAAKAGKCDKEENALLSRVWDGIEEYYKAGMKAGVQLLHEALINRG